MSDVNKLLAAIEKTMGGKPRPAMGKPKKTDKEKIQEEKTRQLARDWSLWF